jgi:hypothetical protein
MRRASLALLLLALPAHAQKEVFFGTGKAPVFKESDTDRRFAKTRVSKALATGTGTEDPNCQQLLGGLLTAVAEAAPYLHKRDENFMVDPLVLQAVQTQLTNDRFPGTAYFAAMVRRVLIDRRVPDEWLATAEAINPRVQIIDVAKLKMLNEGLKPIDSFSFTLAALRERYNLEVQRANSAVTTDVAGAFRDSYLDRDVAWGGVVLLDAATMAPPPKGKGKKKAPAPVAAIEELGAILQWTPPDPHANELNVLGKKDLPPPVKIIARLAPKQFIDLERVPRGKRMLIKGRFWEMNKTVTEVEVRDALLFEDRDFSAGLLLADPAAVAACPLAINELTGVAPSQPGGFKH